MYIVNLIKSDFSNIISENPRLNNSNRSLRDVIGESVFVIIVNHEKHKVKNKPAQKQNGHIYENQEKITQQQCCYNENYNGFYQCFLHEGFTGP